MGILNLYNGSIHIQICLRSSNKKCAEDQINKLRKLSTECGLSFSLDSFCPGFESKENTTFKNTLKETYLKLYNKSVVVNHIHAGLEGGVFSENIPDLDVCVIAAEIYDLHSTKERVDIASVERTSLWIKQALIDFAK